MEGRLLGRAAERASIDQLLDDARLGLSGSLLLVGPAGIGKSTLLDHAIRRASQDGYAVVRAAGVESEVGFGYAGVHQVVTSLLGHGGELAHPQRVALDVALGRAEGAAVDPFMVGLAILTLVAEGARERPLLVVVDDAQWLDEESARALSFVGRRLQAENVAMLIAMREPPARGASFDWIRRVEVAGLDAAEGRQLLDETAGPVDEGVADRLVAESGGNPLALVEIPAALDADQLRGAAPLPDPLPIGERFAELFASRARSLGADARWLLLLMAAEPLGEVAVLRRAAATLGISWEVAAATAEASGLARLGPTVELRHALARSAIYYSASPPQRRAVHAVLADALGECGEADRRAVHLAAASTEPDEAVADELEAAAERARGRGAWSVAAAHFRRAADLTPDAERAAARLLDGARAELAAGRRELAEQTFERATETSPGLGRRADARWTEALIHFVAGEARRSAALLAAVLPATGGDHGLAIGSRVAACAAALGGGHLVDGATRVSIAEWLRRPTAAIPVSLAPLVTGVAARLDGGPLAAMPALREAMTVAAFDRDRFLADAGDHVDVVWFDTVLAAAEVLDDSASDALTRAWVQHARRSGALAALSVALGWMSWLEIGQGRLRSARSHVVEAEELASLAGSRGLLGNPAAARVLHDAWLGDEEATRSGARRMMRDAHERGMGMGVDQAYAAIAVLELGAGRYEAALRASRRIVDDGCVAIGGPALADLVEAAERCGETDLAASALADLSERSALAESAWARGLHARASAMVASDTDAEAHFRSAIDELASTTMANDCARAQLLFGEWLRRARRRRDAREPLHDALDHFEAIGADGFASRARAELAATGERLRTRSSPVDVLTPQEAQIARLAAAGERNRDIAEQLYISTSTVEYHLRKIFMKLEVSSRTQLAQLDLER